MVRNENGMMCCMACFHLFQIYYEYYANSLPLKYDTIKSNEITYNYYTNFVFPSNNILYECLYSHNFTLVTLQITYLPL